MKRDRSPARHPLRRRLRYCRTDAQRMLLCLRYQAHCSAEQIAERLGITKARAVELLEETIRQTDLASLSPHRSTRHYLPLPLRGSPPPA